MIQQGEDGLIRLEGPCRLEEAEDLTRLLQTQVAPVDVSRCTEMHSAVVQALLAFAPPLVGESPAEVLRGFVLAALTSTVHAVTTDPDKALSSPAVEAAQGSQAPGVED